MEAILIPTTKDRTSWDYDAEADVLYVSAGDPRPAVTEDLGDGLLVRYDEDTGVVVGLTVLGLKKRLESRRRSPG